MNHDQLFHYINPFKFLSIGYKKLNKNEKTNLRNGGTHDQLQVHYNRTINVNAVQW